MCWSSVLDNNHKEEAEDSSSGTTPCVSAYQSLRYSTIRNEISHAFPLCFLHTGSDQILEVEGLEMTQNISVGRCHRFNSYSVDT